MAGLDLTGQKFGRLTVIRLLDERTKNGGKKYLCRCDCGTEKVVQQGHLRSGAIKSCGCLLRETTIARNKVEKRKHGLMNTKLYAVWRSMKQRCFDENSSSYFRYGGRGITVCDEWKDDFQAFYDWSMANGYREGLSIDRIDVNGNYEPGNCRWATMKKQANNRTNNTIVEYNGVSKTLSEWAEFYNISYDIFLKRLEGGNSFEDAITHGKLPCKHKKWRGKAPMITLKEAREAAGLTQADLAKMLDLKPTTISGWERGARVPGFNTAKKISKILGVSMDELKIED